MHRDLKPENILLDQFENIKIGDYGLAKEWTLTNCHHTEGMGTPLYEAP